MPRNLATLGVEPPPADAPKPAKLRFLRDVQLRVLPLNLLGLVVLGILGLPAWILLIGVVVLMPLVFSIASLTRKLRARVRRSLKWLPYDFTGVRSPREAQQDLVTIASAGWPRDEAHVTIDPDDGEPVEVSGHVTASMDGEQGPLTVLVDGAAAFDFDLERCRGAWLGTIDEADYYALSIDLGWGRVHLSDAYNGL